MVITTFAEYQAEAMKTQMYPRIHRSLPCKPRAARDCSSPHPPESEELPVYVALAMQGECGEIFEKITSVERHKLSRNAFSKEIGDVLWYITAAAVDLGYSLQYLAGGEPSFQHWQQCVQCVDRSTVLHHVGCLATDLGRFAEHVKKAWRDGSALSKDTCERHLAYALARLHQVATCFYSDLQEVAQVNIDKLTSRRERGTVLGAGDDR